MTTRFGRLNRGRIGAGDDQRRAPRQTWRYGVRSSHGRARADYAMYALLLGHHGPAARLWVTTGMQISFLRRPAPGTMICTLELLKHGRTLSVGDAENPLRRLGPDRSACGTHLFHGHGRAKGLRVIRQFGGWHGCKPSSGAAGAYSSARYADYPSDARITLRATGSVDDQNISCKVDTGRALAVAGLHPATGGTGLELCSGDMLLEALVACAGVTLKAVATALEIPLEAAKVSAEGDLDDSRHAWRRQDSPGRFRSDPPYIRHQERCTTGQARYAAAADRAILRCAADAVLVARPRRCAETHLTGRAAMPDPASTTAA